MTSAASFRAREAFSSPSEAITFEKEVIHINVRLKTRALGLRQLFNVGTSENAKIRKNVEPQS